MTIIKEHSLMLLLSILSILMAGAMCASISFTWKLETEINEKNSLIIEQVQEINSLKIENKSLEKEIDDLMKQSENLQMPVEDLKDMQETIEELKKLLPQ